MIFIGLDPGANGGIAALCGRGHIIDAEKIPATDLDLLRLVFRMTPGGYRCPQCGDSGETHACLEKVSASPQMGVTSAFTFGRGFGKLLMALAAARIPYDLIRPQDWQAVMGCLTRGDKNVSKQRAQALFPSYPKITHAIADALLLAEYCRRFYSGMSK